MGLHHVEEVLDDAPDGGGHVQAQEGAHDPVGVPGGIVFKGNRVVKG